MKNILLKSLLLTNYRNIENAQLKFDGDSKIVGENRIGKTNTLEAIYYLFTDKLLDGSSDLSAIKPLSDTKKEVRVQGVFDIDGKEVTIEKQYGEKWVKQRGTTEVTMQGHYTNYLFDGIKQDTLKEYNRLFFEEFGIKNDQLVKIDFVQMLINPFYLGNLGEDKDWVNLRQFIINLVGDVSDAQVFAKNPSLSIVKEDIEKFGGRLDQIKKKYANDIDGLKLAINGKVAQLELLEKTPCPTLDQVEVAKHGIEEHQANINLLSNKSIDNASVLIKEKIVNKEREISRLEVADLVAQRDNPKRTELQNKLNQLKDDATKQLDLKSRIMSSVSSKEREIRQKQEHLDSLTKERNSLIEKLKECDASLSSVEGQIEKVCPYCGSPLDEDVVESHRQEFIKKINNEKQALLEKGMKSKEERQTLTNEIDRLTKELEELEESIAQADSTIEKLNADVEKATEELESCKVEVVENPKIAELKKELEELNDELQQSQLDYQKGVQDNQQYIYEEKEAMKPFQKILDDFDYYNRQMQQAEVIRTEKQMSEQQLANIEQKKEMLNQFIYTKLKMLDNNVSKVFGHIKFQLIKENINGGFDAICKPYIYDIEKDASTTVTWKSGSKSERVVTGIAIADCIKERLGLPNMPYLFDEGGEISSETFATKFKTESQLICVKIEDGITSPIVAPIRR